MSGQTSTQWFYGRHGEEFGPLEAEQLRALAMAGILRPTDMVWREGLPDWVQADQIKNLFRRAKPAGQGQSESCTPTLGLADPRQDFVGPGTIYGQVEWRRQREPSKAMRLTQNALLVFLVLGSLLLYWHYSRGPVAIESFTEAKERSKETGQDVLFVFTAPWCGACNVMKTALFKNADLVEGRILCLIDYETNLDLVKEHEVKTIPMYGIWRDGKIVKKNVGYPGITKLRKWLDE